MKKIIIPKLDIHAADACNLHCEQCDHYSNYGFKGTLSVEDFVVWCEPWSQKIIPQAFHILGGEPLINDRIGDIVKEARRIWTDSEIILWSNGLLAHKHPSLPKILKDNNVRIQISNHSTANSETYDKKFAESVEVLKQWFEQEEVPITIQFNSGMHVDFARQGDKYLMIPHNVNTGPEGTLWEKFYHGYGKDMKPFNDGNPRLSWENCTAKCPQLYNGRIHKCAPLTYLPLMNDRYKLSSEWGTYLQYKGLSPESTMEEIEAFFNLEDEVYCGMCPSKRPKFTSQLDPLKFIPVKQI